MTVNEKVNIKKIETKILNGRKINIKATLEVEAKVYSNDNMQIVCGVNNADDIQMLNTQKTVNSLIGEGNTKVYASIFNPEEENPVLLPIESDEEWKLIEGILSSLTSDKEQ